MVESSAEVITVKEVALFLKTCPMTIYRMVNDGKIPCFKVGGDWRFRKEAITQWILSKENGNGNGNGDSNGKRIKNGNGMKENNIITSKDISVIELSKN